MRGNIKPTPVYPQDIPGLLAWLNQPPSQWSAVGWQNAPAWGALVVERIGDLIKAEVERDRSIAERDEARQMYCRAFVDLYHGPRLEELSLDEAAAKIADNFDWDCFKKDEANP
jgi:hypothetical protein